MKKDGIELYLSEDIIQGEEIPFYLLWNREDIISFNFEFEGFKSIVEYHNLRDDFSLKKKLITIDDVKTNGYIGGILKSSIFKTPLEKSYLKVVVTLSNKKKIELSEERFLYNTIIEVKNLPDKIKIPFDQPPIELRLRGDTTLFIDIQSSENSELKVVLPKEILDALEKLYVSLIDGLKELKTEFPEYISLIDKFLDVPHKKTLKHILDDVMIEIQKLKPTKSFKEAFALIFVNSLLEQASVKEQILQPLLEYLASKTSNKAFLDSPFSCIQVPKGGGYLKLQFITQNILERYEEFYEQKLSKPIMLETNIESDSEMLLPITELLCIRRV